MADLINRQAAIDVMCKLMNSWFGNDAKDEQREIKWIINHLPSAKSERKKGKWVLEKVYEDEYGNEQFSYFCSKCGAPAYEFRQPFCHKCGLPMEV